MYFAVHMKVFQRLTGFQLIKKNASNNSVNHRDKSIYTSNPEH